LIEITLIAVMEIHILDPPVSMLHRPNVSFIYKQSVEQYME